MGDTYSGFTYHSLVGKTTVNEKTVHHIMGHFSCNTSEMSPVYTKVGEKYSMDKFFFIFNMIPLIPQKM